MNELLLGPNDLKIVVVDDSDFSRSVVIKMLNGAGYKVVGESASASNALQIIKEKNPNVVITDIVMPEISGIELTEKINQDFDNIYVIVISSLSQEHVVLEAIGAGAADFISKPINEQQLVDSLSKILAQINKDKK
jgi:two-component system chemotaxis response regulator CheY